MSADVMDFIIWHGQLIFVCLVLFLVFFVPSFWLVELFCAMFDSSDGGTPS